MINFFMLFLLFNINNIDYINRIGFGQDMCVVTNNSDVYFGRGAEIWKNDTLLFCVDGSYVSDVDVNDTLITVAESNDGIALYDVNGNKLWDTTLDNYYRKAKSVTMTDRMVFVAAGEYGIYFVDLKTGAIINNITDFYNAIDVIKIDSTRIAVLDSMNNVYLLDIYSDDMSALNIVGYSLFYDSNDSILYVSDNATGFISFYINDTIIDTILNYKDRPVKFILPYNNGYVMGAVINYETVIYNADSTMNIIDSLVCDGNLYDMDIIDSTVYVSLGYGGFKKLFIESDTFVIDDNFYGVGEIKDIELYESEICVAGGSANNIMVYDYNLSNHIQTINMTTPVINMCHNDQYLFSANNWGGIHIFEFNGDSIEEISSFSYTNRKANFIQVRDTLLYIADRANGLVIYDVSDIYNPTMVSVDSTYDLYYLQVLDDTLVSGYVVGKGVYLYNLKNINNPLIIDSLSGIFSKMDSSGDTLFLSTTTTTIEIYNIENNAFEYVNTIITDIPSYDVLYSPWHEIYVGGKNGFYVYKSDSQRYITESFFEVYDDIYDIFFDSFYVYFVTVYGGVFKISTDVFSPGIISLEPSSNSAIADSSFSVIVKYYDFQSGVDSVWVVLDNTTLTGTYNDTMFIDNISEVYPEDTYYMDINIKDRMGNINYERDYFMIDRTRPIIDSIIPHTGYTSGDTTIILTLYVTDLSLNGGYAVIDGDTFMGNTVNNILYMMVPLVFDTNEIYCNVYDKVGKSSDTIMYIYKDIYVPQYSYMYPPPFTIINDTVNYCRMELFNIKYDSGLDSVYISIDSERIDSIQYDAGILYAYVGDTLSEGWHSREIYIKDNAGHVLTERDSFGIDITPPVGAQFTNSRNCYYSHYIKLYWTKSTDNFSGVYGYVIKDMGGNIVYKGNDTTFTFNVLNDTAQIFLYVYDYANNNSLQDSMVVFYTNDVLIYPSPLNLNKTDILHIEGVSEGDNIIIFNENGNILKNFVVEITGEAFIDMSKYKRGIYYIYIKSSDGTIKKKKVGIIE